MGGSRGRARELGEAGLGLGDAPERTQCLHARCHTFLREGAARKTLLVLTECPQRLVGMARVQLLLGAREEANLFRKRIRRKGGGGGARRGTRSGRRDVGGRGRGLVLHVPCERKGGGGLRHRREDRGRPGWR